MPPAPPRALCLQDQPDGGFPYAGLTFDARGNIYGTTSEGGAANLGVVFRLAPAPQNKGHEAVLHSLAGAPDGALSYNAMVGDGHGHFFGTTTRDGAGDNGAIYRLTP